MADMGKTEVDAVIQSTVSAMVQDALIEESKLLGTVMQYAVQPGEDTIKIPRADQFTVNDKAENTAVTPQVLTYATDDLVMDKYKVVQVRLEDDARVEAKPDVVADIVDRMAKQIALQIDTDLVTAIKATSAAAPDHRIAYANSGTDNTLGKADILAARELLHVQNIDFSQCFIVVSPASEADLLAIDDFVHSDKYGSAEGLRNGELGRLYGAPVIMTNQTVQLETLIYHPSHVAFGRNINPLFETDRELNYLANLYSLSQKYGVKTLDSGVRGVLVGTAA